MERVMHKLIVQYFEPADPEAFIAAYRERHVPLVKGVPGLERFTLTFPRGEGAPYLVAELWFTDGDALKAGLSGPEMAAAAADAETYDVARRAMSSGPVEDV
jgi:uncharacterized protein (TIGR02118 family)